MNTNVSAAGMKGCPVPQIVELPVEQTGYGQTLVLAEPNSAEVISPANLPNPGLSRTLLS